MASIVELVDWKTIDSLATPSNVRLGRELADAGEVQMTAVSPDRIEARIGGGESGTQHRRAELWAGAHGLSWSCTCTKDVKLFCKHLVAVAFTTDQRRAEPSGK